MASLRASLRERQRSAFDGHSVFIIPKNSEPKPSFFHLILRRDPDLDKSIDIFVRQGITISGLRSLREAGVRALLVASDRPIASFLGDSENPAHTEWQARSRKFQGKYLVGPSTLDFVKDAPRSMMRLLNKRSEMIDETALRHIFPNPSMTGKNAPDKKREVALDPTRTAPPKPTVESKPKSFALSKTREGFTVSLSQFGKSKLPLTLMIRCAYDTGSGNPLKRWSFADFDFAHENMVSMTGGTWLEMSGNTLRVIAESGEFALPSKKRSRRCARWCSGWRG